jgi:hypothetical protein
VIAEHARRAAAHQRRRAQASDDDELEHSHAGWTLHYILFSTANGFRGGPDDRAGRSGRALNQCFGERLRPKYGLRGSRKRTTKHTLIKR